MIFLVNVSNYTSPMDPMVTNWILKFSCCELVWPDFAVLLTEIGGGVVQTERFCFND